MRPTADTRASSYPRAVTVFVVGAAEPTLVLPSLLSFTPNKQKAIPGSDFYLGVQVVKGLWIYPASRLRTQGRTQRRSGPGTRQKSFSRALCAGCFAKETCLNQRRKKIAPNPAVLGMLAGLRLLPAKLSKDCRNSGFGKPRSKRRRITSVRNNNPFNCVHNYSFTSACWPLNKIVLPFFFFFSLLPSCLSNESQTF